MPQNLTIDVGEITITVNEDPTRVFKFNPSDVLFAERFYDLVGEFESQIAAYTKRSKQLEKVEGLDSNGIPVNMKARIGLLKEACNYIREKIDLLFGAGTSQVAFGDALALDMFSQFFEQVTPYVRSQREEKTKKYYNPKVEQKKKRFS